MQTILIVTVTAPDDDTSSIPAAIAHALDNPDNYPDDANTPEWGVSVTSAGALLGQFEALQSSDPVKRDLELTCTQCGTILCDVQDSDELAVLVSVAAGHDCPGDDDDLETVPDHHNDLGDGCPFSGTRTADGTCPQFCREADELTGFDAGDRSD